MQSDAEWETITAHSNSTEVGKAFRSPYGLDSKLAAVTVHSLFKRNSGFAIFSGPWRGRKEEPRHKEQVHKEEERWFRWAQIQRREMDIKNNNMMKTHKLIKVPRSLRGKIAFPMLA